MNKQKIFFILALLGILTLLFLTQLTKPITKGKISQIQYSTSKITIQLENQQTPIILFTNPPINLKQNQQVIIYGKQETYKNQVQIIANKIKCSNYC